MLRRRMLGSRLVAALGCALAASAAATAAWAQRPEGAALVRLLGPRAAAAFAPPGAPGIGALVPLPSGVRASDVGLVEAAPGIGRLYGPPAAILAFSASHPGLPME